MSDFTICAPKPFHVHSDVTGNDYELRRIRDLDAEQIAALAPISEAEGDVERAKAVKAFVQMLCPEIAAEPLTDMGYLALFGQLSAGSNLGES